MTDDTPRRVTPGYFGSAEFACPSGCGTILRTSDALLEVRMSNGLQWQGVPCPTCGTSYTVEMTDEPKDSHP